MQMTRNNLCVSIMGFVTPFLRRFQILSSQCSLSSSWKCNIEDLKLVCRREHGYNISQPVSWPTVCQIKLKVEASKVKDGISGGLVALCSCCSNWLGSNCIQSSTTPTTAKRRVVQLLHFNKMTQRDREGSNILYSHIPSLNNVPHQTGRYIFTSIYRRTVEVTKLKAEYSNMFFLNTTCSCS